MSGFLSLSCSMNPTAHQTKYKPAEHRRRPYRRSKSCIIVASRWLSWLLWTTKHAGSLSDAQSCFGPTSSLSMVVLFSAKVSLYAYYLARDLDCERKANRILQAMCVSRRLSSSDLALMVCFGQGLPSALISGSEAWFDAGPWLPPCLALHPPADLRRRSWEN